MYNFIFDKIHNMSKRALFSLSIIFILSVSGLKAQKLSQFSGDTIKFIKELNDFFL